MKKDRTENIQKTYKKCAPYGNCTEIVQKIYRKCAKICNNSNNETVSTNELLQNLAHFLYIFCTISVQFPYGAHFLYVFCMFSVRSFFIGVMDFPGLLPTSRRLSSLYIPLQLLGTYLKMKIKKYGLILYEHVISLY